MVLSEDQELQLKSLFERDVAVFRSAEHKRIEPFVVVNTHSGEAWTAVVEKVCVDRAGKVYNGFILLDPSGAFHHWPREELSRHWKPEDRIRPDEIADINSGMFSRDEVEQGGFSNGGL